VRSRYIAQSTRGVPVSIVVYRQRAGHVHRGPPRGVGVRCDRREWTSTLLWAATLAGDLAGLSPSFDKLRLTEQDELFKGADGPG
jgi:hypothetical protein